MDRNAIQRQGKMPLETTRVAAEDEEEEQNWTVLLSPIALLVVVASSSPNNHRQGVSHVIDRNLQVIGIYGRADPVEIHSRLSIFGDWLQVQPGDSATSDR